ncbi:MAG: DNA-binding protein WhiA [Saccharofermentanales bacterium]
MSFSTRIKDEYCEINWNKMCCAKAEMLASLLCSARFRQGQIAISTAHEGYSKRLSSMIDKIYSTKVKITHGRELYNIHVDEKSAYDDIIADLREQAGFDAVRGTMSSLTFTSTCCRRAFLRGLFLSSGSVIEPNKSYHLEITARRLSVAEAALRLLEQDEIQAGILRRSGYYSVYMKEGQQISDFLLITGAHEALLEFESLRVDKSVRNSVNRVVNCDNANSIRIAYTGARQQEALEYIAENIGLGTLPKELQDAAQMRMDYPDLSLKELGELMNPPLGKSGMNHRLKKLEQIASDHMLKFKIK